jgi:hypothetical protein
MVEEDLLEKKFEVVNIHSPLPVSSPGVHLRLLQDCSIRCCGSGGGWGVERRISYLEAQDLGLDQGEGLAVNLDEALALL